MLRQGVILSLSACFRGRWGKAVLARLEEVLQNLCLHLLEQLVGKVPVCWVGHLDVILELGLSAAACERDSYHG